MKQQLLLLEDVDGLGRSGDLVTAKRGYIRNYLLPEKKAVIASAQTLKMQEKLKKEREARALVDRKEAEELAAKLTGLVLTVEVKVDPEGHLYGSVTASDIARLMQEKGFPVERKNLLLPQPIKTLGAHSLNLRLKEGVLAKISVEVTSEDERFSSQSAKKEEKQ